MPALVSVFVMIDIGLSASFCVAFAWKAARSCSIGLVLAALVELVALVALVELVELVELAELVLSLLVAEAS